MDNDLLKTICALIAIKHQRRVNAIRIYRSVTDCTLKEAKYFVDQLGTLDVTDADPKTELIVESCVRRANYNDIYLLINKNLKCENDFVKFVAQGKWQREMPTEEGVYFVRARDVPVGQNMITLYKDPEGKIKSTQSWGGWWWSKPIPELPPTPDMEKEE
jgi:hypothetical protein